MIGVVLLLLIAEWPWFASGDANGWLVLQSSCVNFEALTLSALQQAPVSDYGWLPLDANTSNPCGSLSPIGDASLQLLIVTYIASVPTFRTTHFLLTLLNVNYDATAGRLVASGSGPFGVIDLGGRGALPSPIDGFILDGNSFRNGLLGNPTYYTTASGLMAYNTATLGQYVEAGLFLVRPSLGLAPSSYSAAYKIDTVSVSTVTTFVTSLGRATNLYVTVLNGEWLDSGVMNVTVLGDAVTTTAFTTPTPSTVPPTSTLLTLPPSSNAPSTTVPFYVWIIVAIGGLLLIIVIVIAAKRKKDHKRDLKKEEKYRSREMTRVANVMRELGVDSAA